MKNRALALAVVSACGFAPQAFSHQLAFSKTEQISVIVDGEATTWCKPEIAITMQRPTWVDQKPLNGLLSKLPFILGQECSTAKVTWKAVDAKGAVYATGSGNATNLGLATLTAPPAPVAAAPAPVAAEVPAAPVAAAPAPVAAPVVEAPAVVAPVVAVAPTAPAPAPVVAEVAAPAPAPTPAPVAAAPVAPAPAEPAAVAPVPQPVVVAPIAAPTTPAAPTAQPASIAAAPTADFGRSVVLGNHNLVGITDESGCKWLISKSAVDESNPSFSFTSTPAMPCGVAGYGVGQFDKLKWSIPNTYRGDTWNKPYVHESGLMFNQTLSQAVKDKAVSFLSAQADQALFLLGEIPSRDMKVYLAFQRPTYAVLRPFDGKPYYVAITKTETFALDPAEYKRAAVEIYQLIKATSPSTVEKANFFIAKDFEALYPAAGYKTDDTGNIVQNQMGENRGEFYFDAREGKNYAMRREAMRLREVRREQERMAELHTRVLERYQQIKDRMKSYQGREMEALAQMSGIKVAFPTPMSLLDPNTSNALDTMMIHVTGKKGDFYEIDFPRKGRVQADFDLEEQWYLIPASNSTPYNPLKDGRAIPTFRVYGFDTLEACKQGHCADRVSFGGVLAKEFPNAGINFDWTPAVSEQFVNAWQQASATIQ